MEIEKNLNTEKRFRATNPGSKPVCPLKQGEVDLFNLNLSASFLKGCLESLSVFLGNAFLDLGRHTLDQSLGLSQTQTGDAADFLDDLDLLSAELGHDNVKLGLLFHRGGSGGSGRSGSGGGGNAEGLLKGVDKLSPAPLRASDLRAGAAMVVAALMADGTSEIEEIGHIERGYENIVEKLRGLGADISKVDRAPAALESAM